MSKTRPTDGRAPAIALLGFGRWGRNHARTLHGLGLLAAVCESDEAVRAQAAALHKGVPVFPAPGSLPLDRLDGIVLATPAATHADLARWFLERGKHVLVEKPLALHVPEAEALVELARRKGLILQVGHILEYHPARREIEKLLAAGALGRLLSARLVRTSLGTIRDVEDVLFSFAPHDIAFALSLAGAPPVSVRASGFDLLGRSLADTAHLTLMFTSRASLPVHISVSWLEPHKEHRAILVGDKGMLEWNDTPGNRSLTLFRTSLASPSGSPKVSLTGQETVPIPEDEPLKLELLDFVDCIRTGHTPRASGEQGLAVLRVLDAARHSMAETRFR